MIKFFILLDDIQVLERQIVTMRKLASLVFGTLSDKIAY